MNRERERNGREKAEERETKRDKERQRKILEESERPSSVLVSRANWTKEQRIHQSVTSVHRDEHHVTPVLLFSPPPRSNTQCHNQPLQSSSFLLLLRHMIP